MLHLMEYYNTQSTIDQISLPDNVFEYPPKVCPIYSPLLFKCTIRRHMVEINWHAEEAEIQTNIDSHMGLIVKAKISILKEDKMSIQTWIRHFLQPFQYSQ